MDDSLPQTCATLCYSFMIAISFNIVVFDTCFDVQYKLPSIKCCHDAPAGNVISESMDAPYSRVVGIPFDLLCIAQPTWPRRSSPVASCVHMLVSCRHARFQVALRTNTKGSMPSCGRLPDCQHSLHLDAMTRSTSLVAKVVPVLGGWSIFE
ncbi:hypothetical protein H310_03648 [Aphanomyces invadans]|uniref:Uncharacterized protein n=1 Tax=Aphanomyces invadans TaxID=157072 RepID=A0A024UIN7_9STRA|nr:hypothetical protein H310_03648 [Aphanomyces invadans]ETW06050.1 hypothetical protein H310_03648 [Aphanomyces invadans]|eukprot:XP_008865827.1 hypothetical protein H310_03648 [Aphanomyces invadans]